MFPTKRHCVILFIGMFNLTTVYAKSRIQARIDCLSRLDANQGGTQACLSISQLAITIEDEVSQDLSAEVQLDPFGTPYSPFRDLPRADVPLVPLIENTRLSLVSDYGLHWRFRNNLQLSLEEVSGVASLPNASGLSLGSKFQDSGWDQTAITALYRLPPLSGINVKLMIGNGEGENGRNLDPQQFGGLEIEAFLLEGIFLKLAMSYDGNNLGSEQFEWVYGTSTASQGFATERQAIAIGLTGERPGLRGLKLSIGWQRSRVNDLDKSEVALPTTFPFNEEQAIDVNNLLVESTEKAIQLQRTVLNLGASYRILAEYLVGVDFESRTIHTDAVDIFESCEQISDAQCVGSKGRRNQLTQTSYTLGFGKELVTDHLGFTLEYSSSAYDKLYRFFNFRGDDNRKIKSHELVNVRIAYQW